MAKKLTPESENPSGNAGHNAKARAKTIRDAISCIVGLKAQRAAIQEQITEAKGKVKELGIKMAEFNVALRLYELEREDRDEALDQLRECFDALKIGEQLDFLSAMPPVGGEPAAAGNA